MRRAGSGSKRQIIKKITPPHCSKCGASSAIRSGMVQGVQRWKCKECRYQFTRTSPRGRPLWQKSLAVFLYSQGMPLHRIGEIFHVQPSTVLKWVRHLSGHAYAVHESGNILMMELGELQRRLGKSDKGSGKTLCIAIDDKTFRKNTGISITPGEPSL